MRQFRCSLLGCAFFLVANKHNLTDVNDGVCRTDHRHAPENYKQHLGC
jgi:hypothetical protein